MSTSQHVTRLVGGRYRLDSLLGQGAMGRVWAAHDEVLDREVAVKEVLVPPAVPEAEREALVARTLREGRAAARVRHPRVVTVYDVVEDDDRPWLVLQRLAPRTLADVLAAEGPLHPARAAVIGLQVLEGLAAVHAAGVLHRDVKPANVLFGPDGGAVLADFGVATLEDDAAVTSTGLVLGSPAYLAPERARGEVPTPAADLWSLGAMLFAAVEGRSPFHREGPLPTLGALLTQDVPDAPAAGPLAPAIAALLTKDPAARPDAEAARALLLAALTAPAPATGRTSPVPPTTEAGAGTHEPEAAEMTAPMATHEAWEVPSRPVPRPSRVPAPAASVPSPRRRALVALAVAAVLAAPVAALAQRPGASLSDLPAAAGGTTLFSTTPKVTVPAPAARSRTTAARTLPKTGSAPAVERAVARVSAPPPAAASHPTARATAQLAAGSGGAWNENQGDKHQAKDKKKAEEKKGKAGKGKKDGGHGGKHGGKGGGGKHGHGG